ncbi:hypothetical protein [Actinomadura chokoriensis]|uniref:DUF3024 domain-containing protein n=1 Tax=Actinomadura chokoriensis TaxID=454156 RepID=A0ABV4QXL1_9ACTN
MAAFDELPRMRRGPLHALYAALRRRAPQVSAARPDAAGGGTGDGAGAGLRVAYRGQAAVVVWDDDLGQYGWSFGDAGRLGSDVEKAAELVAWTLGATVSSGGAD